MTRSENFSASQVLRPFDIAEAVSTGEAAKTAGRSTVTIRQWAAVHDLGRLVGGRMMLSRVALAMFLDDDAKALRAYLSGDRQTELVTKYFARFGLEAKKS